MRGKIKSWRGLFHGDHLLSEVKKEKGHWTDIKLSYRTFILRIFPPPAFI